MVGYHQVMAKIRNLHSLTVSGFGQEWGAFDQSEVSEDELHQFFSDYFSLVDWSRISNQSLVMDVGCGSGRWAKFIAPIVGTLHLVDPSDLALTVAREKLKNRDNCLFHNLSTEFLPGDDGTYDFIYSLGVLHHIPDTQAAIFDCVKKLKPGAPFLVYLYYRFDNRVLWFRGLWMISDCVRRFIARTPFFIKRRVTDLLAILVYWPLARFSKILDVLGRDVSPVPLSFYRHSSLYTMRTDALDRFGTRLEHRFTRTEIQQMLEKAGLINIQFREKEPYWCAIGYRSQDLSPKV